MVLSLTCVLPRQMPEPWLQHNDLKVETTGMCAVNNENYTRPAFLAEISVVNSTEEKSSRFIMLTVSPLCLNFVLNSSRIESHQHGI